jgi:hypothetical protein
MSNPDNQRKNRKNRGPTETVSMPIAAMQWSNCPRAWVFLKKGTLEIHYAATGNGTVTLKNSEYTEVTFTGYHCVYGSGSGVHFGTLKGGTEPAFEVEAGIKRIAGNILGCPNEIRWTAHLSITSPTPLYVAAS